MFQEFCNICNVICRFVNESLIIPSTRELFFEINAELTYEDDATINNNIDIIDRFENLVNSSDIQPDKLTPIIKDALKPLVDNPLRLSVYSPR